MKLKKTLIIALFLLCLLMIGAVSASDNTTKDVVSSDVSDDTDNLIGYTDVNTDINNDDLTKNTPKISEKENTDKMSKEDDKTINGNVNTAKSFTDLIMLYKITLVTIR